MATTARVLTVGQGGDVAAIGTAEALFPADITAAGTNETWELQILKGQIRDCRVQITGTTMDSQHWVWIHGMALPTTASAHGSPYGGTLNGATNGLIVNGASAYVILEDMCFITSSTPGYGIQVTGAGATLICRRIILSGGDRNTSFFVCGGATSTMLLENCIGLYPGDSSTTASFKCTAGSMLCIGCISVGAANANFFRSGGTARGINCYALVGTAFRGAWILSGCASSEGVVSNALYFGGGGAAQGAAAVTGGALAVRASGAAMAYSLAPETETPRTAGAVVCAVQWDSSGASASEVAVNLNPNAIVGSSNSANRVVVYRTSAEAARVDVYNSAGSATAVTGGSVADTNPHVLTAFWNGWTGAAGAASAGIGIDGGAPTTSSGLTLTRNTTGAEGEMTLGNVHDGSRTVPLNGVMSWFAKFNTMTPTVNGNLYDLSGAYTTANLKADLDADLAAYVAAYAATPLDPTIVMGNGDVQAYHDFSGNSADMAYRKGRAPTYGNEVVSVADAAVTARMNPYLAFIFDPANREGKLPGRAGPAWEPIARVNHSPVPTTSGDAAVFNDGLTCSTGFYTTPLDVSSGKAYGGSDRTIWCLLRVFNGPAADSQRGLVHCRESTITNNTLALSTAATGEFTARYTNGAGTATVATSVAKLSSLADGIHLIKVQLSQSSLLLSIYIDEVLDGTADATGKANQSNGPAINMRVGTFNDGSDHNLGANLRIERVYVTGNLLNLTASQAIPVFSDLLGMQDNLLLTQHSVLRGGGVVITAPYTTPARTLDNQGIGNNPAYAPRGPTAGQRHLVTCG